MADRKDREPAPQDSDELSVEELESAAGGIEGDNTNCSQSCTSNSSCKPPLLA
ncbi:hypothetical protein [Longimicrobium sp.]|uniref:hypothetical protein n=1 Tax=Longimicrobium sp. TaxID=2029185 RepID=UPI002CDEB1C0|nr:hypothetical protein [Longimicrobium sp.]HSU15722.1 hypothetical protein [Longimicrobium sp.]